MLKSKPDKKCNVFQEFVFPLQRWYGTQKQFLRESSTRGTYMNRDSIFGHVRGGLECLEYVVVGQNSVFRESLSLNARLEFLSIFPGMFRYFLVFRAIKLPRSLLLTKFSGCIVMPLHLAFSS